MSVVNKHERTNIVQYTFIVILVILFIVTFIYQNIEYMRLKMKYKSIEKVYALINEEYDKVIYELHKAISMENIERFAQKNNLYPITKDQVFMIVNKGK